MDEKSIFDLYVTHDGDAISYMQCVSESWNIPSRYCLVHEQISQHITLEYTMSKEYRLDWVSIDRGLKTLLESFKAT